MDAWARGQGVGGLEGARPIFARWSGAVRRSLGEKPPRTKPGWGKEAWAELAGAFAPKAGKAREKRFLYDLLHGADDRRLGAFPTIWQLQAEFDDDGFSEELLHRRLEKREPDYGSLLQAIRAYETFARSLQDAFDVLKAEAAGREAQGFALAGIARDDEFKRSVKGLHEHFEAAHQALGEVTLTSVSVQNLFSQRFRAFAEPMEPAVCALALQLSHNYSAPLVELMQAVKMSSMLVLRVALAAITAILWRNGVGL
ncbi:MAG: hypothetical protein AB1898_11775 [Acidobacteriota bacterium]